MSDLAVVVLVMIDIACYTCQTFFNKLFSISYEGRPEDATPVYAGIYGVIVGVTTWFASGGLAAPSAITWIFGLANGVVLFLFNLSSIRAAQTGPYSFQAIMMLFGCVLLPLLFY